MVFLKGYQWPFDSRKIAGGSSLVDILVYIETVIKGRRVFLDFRENPAGFSVRGPFRRSAHLPDEIARAAGDAARRAWRR